LAERSGRHQFSYVSTIDRILEATVITFTHGKPAEAKPKSFDCAITVGDSKEDEVAAAFKDGEGHIVVTTDHPDIEPGTKVKLVLKDDRDSTYHGTLEDSEDGLKLVV
jgi:hypothetical protein